MKILVKPKFTIQEINNQIYAYESGCSPQWENPFPKCNPQWENPF